MTHTNRHERLIYLGLWTLLFIAPVLSLYIRTHSTYTTTGFEWSEVFVVWRQYAVFLLVFLLHNHLLAPLLVYRQKKVLYFLTSGLLLTLFMVYQCNTHPDGPRRGPRRAMIEQRNHLQPPPNGEGYRSAETPPPVGGEWGEADDAMPRFEREPRHRQHELRNGRRPLMLDQHDIIAAVILVLMLGMNDGVKLYFRSLGDQRKLVRLEKENLEQQLEYLKYQINPHFFMNTLNNIHALVDIDPERAKDTILELSRMMRFVLYEGNKQGVPLSREFDFIRNYITLMRLRYTDKVRIDVQLPATAPDRQLPPLLLITFIENAFKHGISYQHDSFVEVAVTLLDADSRLHFSCRNSKADQPNQEKGGVGLANVKQRLRLLYDSRYTLNITDDADVYSVELEIPI